MSDPIETNVSTPFARHGLIYIQFNMQFNIQLVTDALVWEQKQLSLGFLVIFSCWW